LDKVTMCRGWGWYWCGISRLREGLRQSTAPTFTVKTEEPWYWW